MDWIVKKGWYFLLAAIIGEIVIPIILTPFYKGYDPMTAALSSLGNVNSPVKTVYNFWMLIAGVLFLLSIPALFESLRRTSLTLSIICVACIAVFAVGACIFTCFFSVNESKAAVTTASQIHGVGSAVGFMLMLFVPLLMAILLNKAGDKLTGAVSGISFIIALICFVLFVMSDKPEFQNTLIAKEGLWQRLNLLFMYLPLGFLAFTNLKSFSLPL